MLRALKIFLWIGLLAVGLQSARAFSLLGPIGNAGDAWQTAVIGYGIGADIGAPKNLGEEYRWNVPVFYYSMDQTYLDYFGSNGIVEADKAFAMLNAVFTNGVDSFSADLSEFPLDSKQLNYDARALYLCDLKSVILQTMVEIIGLAEPERYSWTLRERILQGNVCPDDYIYTVVKRNFDPITFEPTRYVNGNLYTYVIIENCNPPNPLAYTSIFVVDPVPEFGLTSVAGFGLFYPSSPAPVGYGGGVDIGAFYTSLTRDEAGGLKYLYRTNNMNFENVVPGATLFTLTTNTAGGGQILTTLDLGPFLSLLPTTDPNTLSGLYPNLDITSVVTNYVLITQTNIITSTNTLPWLPAGFLVAVSQTVQTNFFAQRYTYTFGNIVTNHIYTNWSTVTKTLTITPQPFAPAGSGLITTNTSSVSVKGVGGDFYILPPGISGYVFQPGLVITNKGTITTTTTLTTDSAGAAVTQQQIVRPSTNYSYIVYTIQLQATTNALQMQGIGKITFIRRDYDSLIGRFFQSVSNNYTLTSIENSKLIKHPVQRVVNAPDILISTTDHGSSGYVVSRGISYGTNNTLPGLAGPGTITDIANIDLNRGAPLFLNVAAGTEADHTVLMVWGSFDGTTNPPVVYPSWASVANLENQVLMHVTSTVLPAGSRGVAYNGAGFQLTGTGGSSPYTWTIAGNSALPPGLVLSPDGIISGVPTNAATFDFTVRMTDIGARSIDQPLSITINP